VVRKTTEKCWPLAEKLRCGAMAPRCPHKNPSVLGFPHQAQPGIFLPVENGQKQEKLAARL
jgi:hypothetical protein